MKIILASASPRRHELLLQLNLNFKVQPSGCQEIITQILPKDVVLELATQKALDVYEKSLTTLKGNKDDFLVIGADTIVAYGNNILGKPKDEKDAANMLFTLQGNQHQVYTGVCVLLYKDQKQTTYTFYESTQVSMYPMSQEEITQYILTKEPLDKAGSYGIQGLCAKYIKEIKGDYNNVVGLPIGRLWQEVLKFIL